MTTHEDLDRQGVPDFRGLGDLADPRRYQPPADTITRTLSGRAARDAQLAINEYAHHNGDHGVDPTECYECETTGQNCLAHGGLRRIYGCAGSEAP